MTALRGSVDRLSGGCCVWVAALALAWAGAALGGESPASSPKESPPAPEPARPPAAEWVNVTNNVGGDAWGYAGVCTVACKPGADEVIAGVSERGLWSSTDGGQTWAPLGGDAKVKIAHRPYAIVFDPQNPDTFWESGNYGMGLFKTTDGGKTFERLGATIANVDGLSIDFGDPARQTIVIGFHEKARSVMRSADGGKTWRAIGSSLPEKSNHSSNPFVVDAKTYLVNTAGWLEGHSVGVYRTEDAGQKWTQVSDFGTAGQPLAASDGCLYWAQIWDRGLLKSADQGKTWTALPGPVKRTPIEAPGGKLVAAASSQVHLSADGGQTWRPVGPPAPFAPSVVAYSEKRHCLYVARSSEKKSDNAIARLDLAKPRSEVLWDGDTLAKGGGWAEPKAASTIKLQTGEAHGGKGAVQLHAEGKTWAGGGWNWLAWWPKDGGTDLTGFKSFVLWMKVVGAKPQGGGLKIALECSGEGAKPSAEADVLKHCSEIFDGKWRQIVIPIAEFCAGKPEFNPKKAWQFNVTASGADVKLDVYLDDIRLEDDGF